MNINQHEAEGSGTLIRDDQDAEASIVWGGRLVLRSTINLNGRFKCIAKMT